MNTLVNEFEFQPTLEGFFSKWDNQNLGPIRKEPTLQEIQVGKQLFLTEIDRVANNNADYQEIIGNMDIHLIWFINT